MDGLENNCDYIVSYPFLKQMQRTARNTSKKMATPVTVGIRKIGVPDRMIIETHTFSFMSRSLIYFEYNFSIEWYSDVVTSIFSVRLS